MVYDNNIITPEEFAEILIQKGTVLPTKEIARLAVNFNGELYCSKKNIPGWPNNHVKALLDYLVEDGLLDGFLTLDLFAENVKNVLEELGYEISLEEAHGLLGLKNSLNKSCDEFRKKYDKTM